MSNQQVSYLIVGDFNNRMPLEDDGGCLRRRQGAPPPRRAAPPTIEERALNQWLRQHMGLRDKGTEKPAGLDWFPTHGRRRFASTYPINRQTGAATTPYTYFYPRCMSRLA